MKRILYLIVAFAMLSMAVSCGNDDEPRRGDGVFTVNTPMINHMYNTLTGEVLGLSKTYNKLVIDTIKHQATLEFTYNDGTEKTIKLDDLKATPKRLRFYELTSASNGNFSGYVDFNESSIQMMCVHSSNRFAVTLYTSTILSQNCNSNFCWCKYTLS